MILKDGGVIRNIELLRQKEFLVFIIKREIEGGLL